LGNFGARIRPQQRQKQSDGDSRRQDGNEDPKQHVRSITMRTMSFQLENQF
jgi:hypothetical protein